MKLMLISDIHFGARKNNSTFKKIIPDFFYDLVSPKIIEESIDQLWILGDLFDDRKLIEVDVKKSCFKVLDHLLQTHENLKINILLGNHDIFYRNSLDVTSLRMFFDYHERLHIINSFEEMELDGCKTAIFPWLYENSKEHSEFIKIVDEYEETKQIKYDLCLGHFEISGFQVVKGVEFNGNIKIKHFEAFEHVFSGHFHIRQKIGNIQYCGSPYEITWNDYDDCKGLTIFDTKTKKSSFIENTISPKHKIIKLSEIKDDFEKLNNIDGAWVKFIIDEKISTDKKILMDLEIDKYSPLNLLTIDEYGNSEDDESEDDEEQDEDGNVSLDGNELTFLNKYIDNIYKDSNSSKLKLYANELYLESLRGNE